MTESLARFWSWTLSWLPARRPVNPVQRLIGASAYQDLLTHARKAIVSSKAALPAGFGDDDLVLVYLYTHQELRTYHYRNINAVLRGAWHPKKKQLLALASLLSDALRKMPPFVGQSVRIMQMDAATAAQHQVGHVVCYKAFTSSGDTHWTPAPGQVRLTIAGKSGRFIGDLSRFPHEREVLFLPGTRFRVLAANSIAGTIHYVLEEL